MLRCFCSCRGISVAGYPEIAKAPLIIKQEKVVWFHIPMDYYTPDANESPRDIYQDWQDFLYGSEALRLSSVAQRLFRARHDQCVVIFPFATI